jgi:hypothetical protein
VSQELVKRIRGFFGCRLLGLLGFLLRHNLSLLHTLFYLLYADSGEEFQAREILIFPAFHPPASVYSRGRETELQGA